MAAPVVTPSPTTIEAALEKVLASTPLRGSPRLRRLLEHVVRVSLEGQGDHLKEYTVGVDVFDRGVRFDVARDAIVRVQARKLRLKLEQYYRTEGARDRVIIQIPRGTYRPSFQQADDPPPLLDDPAGLCAHAVQLAYRRTPASALKAARLARCAVVRWPADPRPRLALVEATIAALVTAAVAPRDGIRRLRKAVRDARDVDPHRGELHVYERLPVCPGDTALAGAARRALRLAPASPHVHFHVALIAALNGDAEEAITRARHASRIGTATLHFHIGTAVLLFMGGRGEQARRCLQDLVALEPHQAAANAWLAQVSSVTGCHEEAIAAGERACALERSPFAVCSLAEAAARAGRRAMLEPLLDELLRSARTGYVPGSWMANVHLARREPSLAVRELDRADREGDVHLPWIGVDPRWASRREPWRAAGARTCGL